MRRFAEKGLSGNALFKVRQISTAEAIGRERRSAAQTYHPLPVVWERARDCHVWDVEGKRYLDFLAAYSAVNQGHCHPRLINAMVEQAGKLELSSRAFYSAKFGEFSEFVTKYFGYERVLPMNSGAEAVETALKLSRKWGYEKKGIPPNEAQIVVMKENFHGRTISIVSMSTDDTTKGGFGPYTPGFVHVEFGNYQEIEQVLNSIPNVAAVLLEPIQGEAGVKIPPKGYLSQVRKLCHEKNVLFVVDEIQSGLGRAGTLLAYCGDCEGRGEGRTCGCASANMRPDLVILGKALSGGLYPISCVLGSESVMSVLGHGTHGSTYGGNAIASAIAIEALNVLKEEKLVENSYKMGELFRSSLSGLKELPWVADIRGRGLFNAIEVQPNATISAWKICLCLAKRGLLCKPTHDNIIRLTPPLTITASQIQEAAEILNGVFKNVNNLKESDFLPDNH